MRAAPLILLLLLAGCVEPAASPGPAASSPAAEPPAASRLAEGAPHAQEPHVAVRGDLVVVAAQELVVDAQGSAFFAIHVHRSEDAGATWTVSRLPQEAILAEVDPAGRLRDGGDAVLAFAPDGALYLAGVAAAAVGASAEIYTLTDLTVFVARSDDGGATWGPALHHASGVGPAIGISADKPWIDVAPEGAIHLVHTRFVQPLTLLRHARSFDGGASWSESTIAAGDVLDLGQLNGATIAAAGGGRLYVSVMDIHPLPALPLRETRTRQLVMTSPDDGETWSGWSLVAPATFPRYGIVVADPADPAHALVAVSDDAPAPRVVVRETRDAGATWGAPIPLASGRDGGQQLPAAYVDGLGRAHVLFYDAAWPGGERVVLATIEAGAVVGEVPAPGEAISPGADRREYMGLSGDATRAFGAWVGGSDATGTFIGVAAFAL